MLFKVVGTFRSALSRQIFEAVRIKNRGIHALNSKGEYNRCRIHILTIREDDVKTNSWLEDTPRNADNGTEGEHYMMEMRREMDKKGT